MGGRAMAKGQITRDTATQLRAIADRKGSVRLSDAAELDPVPEAEELRLLLDYLTWFGMYDRRIVDGHYVWYLKKRARP
ncbi:hypothetical protein PAA26_04535 [Methanomassiliicoccaceae archaeon COG_1]|nr:hypothetical protein [Methanomassiliicoccaceae archaeon COG_1]